MQAATCAVRPPHRSPRPLTPPHTLTFTARPRLSYTPSAHPPELVHEGGILLVTSRRHVEGGARVLGIGLRMRAAAAGRCGMDGWVGGPWSPRSAPARATAALARQQRTSSSRAGHMRLLGQAPACGGPTHQNNETYKAHLFACRSRQTAAPDEGKVRCNCSPLPVQPPEPGCLAAHRDLFGGRVGGRGLWRARRWGAETMRQDRDARWLARRAQLARMHCSPPTPRCLTARPQRWLLPGRGGRTPTTCWSGGRGVARADATLGVG
jgi:hypothetical protein